VTGATDEKLMQAVAGGDLDAFNDIVLRYQGLAWKTAHRFIGDPMEAQDVAQEAFLKILEAAPRYREEGAFRTYFYRILTHLCIDRTRRKHPVNIDDFPNIPDPSPGPTDILIDEERRTGVRGALDTLPPNQKAAMILKHFEGLSYVEIARVLGITPKAVERLISRAGTSLRALIGS
jgi:RNA polymerase sigma-70 factor (ECF subfamily)